MPTRRALAPIALALAAVTATGCARRIAAPPRSQVFDALDQPYTLDTGDKLRVIVFGQPDLSNVYAIDGAGKISMPLIGQVDARAATTRELETRIAARLRNGLLRDPQVTIEVDTYRPFFILGEVVQSGQFPYVVGMTVQNAVAIAGGFSPRAQQSTVEITRVVAGEHIRARVPIHHPIRPGDTIRVNERWF
jgi:polysaccharide export outer membrane protein